MLTRFSLFRVGVGALILVFSPLSIHAAPDLGLLGAEAQRQSLNLDFLLQRALQTHPQVDAGRADVRSATQGVKTARWQYFPTPAVSYQRAFADDNDPSFQGDDYATVVSLE